MMPWRRSASAAQRAWELARLAWQLPEYLRDPLDRERAATALRQRLAQRDERFLTTLRRHVDARPSGPLARLLAWAGWTMSDVAAAVRRDGIAAALARLRDAGVYVTHEELLGAVALQRPGLTLTVHPNDFDNLMPSGARLSGATSGSRSHGIRVFYTWEFLAEEAANEALLFAAHGLLIGAVRVLDARGARTLGRAQSALRPQERAGAGALVRAGRRGGARTTGCRAGGEQRGIAPGFRLRVVAVPPRRAAHPRAGVHPARRCGARRQVAREHGARQRHGRAEGVRQRRGAGRRCRAYALGSTSAAASC